MYASCQRPLGQLLLCPCIEGKLTPGEQMVGWECKCARLCQPCYPRARIPLPSAHSLHLPVPIDTAKAEGQEHDEHEKDQDEDYPQRGHRLLNKEKQY